MLGRHAWSLFNLGIVGIAPTTFEEEPAAAAKEPQFLGEWSVNDVI